MDNDYAIATCEACEEEHEIQENTYRYVLSGHQLLSCPRCKGEKHSVRIKETITAKSMHGLLLTIEDDLNKAANGSFKHPGKAERISAHKNLERILRNEIRGRLKELNLVVSPVNY